MAPGFSLRPPVSGKPSSGRNEVRIVTRSIACIGAATIAGNVIVAPAAQAVNKNAYLARGSSTSSSKGTVGLSQKALKLKDGVDWSLFFSTLRSV